VAWLTERFGEVKVLGKARKPAPEETSKAAVNLSQ